ncbi:MAG: glucose-1-phosphate adenylyltransferase [Gemmataceae bacterium]
MREVLGLILGGGRGTRLYPLTRSRSKPAVPVGGKYRLIDIPISNCINSGMHRIYVVTQFLSVSLHNHVTNTYKFDMFNQGFVEILAAQQTNETADWYQGTADAVRQNLRYIDNEESEEILVLSGDQIYRMDFRAMIERHRTTRADVTIAVLPVARENTSQFGILKVDSTGRVSSFLEKPTTEEQLAPFTVGANFIQSQGIEPKGREFLASMGIYLFNRQTLRDLLLSPPPATDFGKEVFPRCVREGYHIQTHLFDGFWEDLGTVKSYHQCHMDLTGDDAPFRFHSSDGVIYTRMRNLPPSRVVGAVLDHAIVSDGCMINEGAHIEHSIVGIRSRIGRNVRMKEVVMIGADKYDREPGKPCADGRPAIGVGDDAVIERAILDKDCRIGVGAKITNAKNIQEAEGENFVIREGIVVIPRGAVVRDGEVI